MNVLVNQLAPYLSERMGIPIGETGAGDGVQESNNCLDGIDSQLDDDTLDDLLEEVESLSEEEVMRLLDDE